jgi:hypothetical protein
MAALDEESGAEARKGEHMVSTEQQGTDRRCTYGLGWQCPWCIRERGEEPRAGITDGICYRHYRAWRKQAHAYREQQARRRGLLS